MQIFVYEFASATGAAPSLRAEGEAMLSAVTDDFERVPGVCLMSWPKDGTPSEEAMFRALARVADFTLVIAPELDGILFQRCRWVEEEGGRLLGPSSAAVALAGDKLQLAEHLTKHGVATPPCRLVTSLGSKERLNVPRAHGASQGRADGHRSPLACAAGSQTPFLPNTLSDFLSQEELAYPLVWKPRFGAGSTATFLIRTLEDWSIARAVADREAWHGESLVQPWLAGLPVSVAFLIGPDDVLALLPAMQQLSRDGRFHYLGGTIPIAPELAKRATRLARQAVTAVPGLVGYVGVDLVVGDKSDGSADAVIEINPRLTTSYVGLRALCQGNLAEAMLRVVAGQRVTPLRWLSGSVRFSADGRVQVDRANN